MARKNNCHFINQYVALPVSVINAMMMYGGGGGESLHILGITVTVSLGTKLAVTVVFVKATIKDTQLFIMKIYRVPCVIYVVGVLLISVSTTAGLLQYVPLPSQANNVQLLGGISPKHLTSTLSLRTAVSSIIIGHWSHSRCICTSCVVVPYTSVNWRHSVFLLVILTIDRS